ncbi:hypothetical protein LI328DRAFT_73225 [Trichoderma asperelloides]|nr:hypothetical protein LI328DRAFT_73225 [Trichoderma asperelloides]
MAGCGLPQRAAYSYWWLPFCFSFYSICVQHHHREQVGERERKTTQSNGTKPKLASPQSKLVVSHWAPPERQGAQAGSSISFLIFGFLSFGSIPPRGYCSITSSHVCKSASYKYGVVRLPLSIRSTRLN